MKKFFLLTSALLLCQTGWTQIRLDKSTQAALDNISGDSIRAHIAWLSRDELKGRLPATPEYKMAMDYAVQKFKSYGLEPAGENGTYLQKVTIKTAKLKTGEMSVNELKDEWFDFGAGRKYAQVNFLISYLAAQKRQTPAWKAGSLFKP